MIAHLGKAVGSEGLVAGQIVGIAAEGDQAVDLKTLEYVHMHKTAVLLGSSVVSGAIVGGASEDEIQRLSEYARSVGLLFQVRGCLSSLIYEDFVISPLILSEILRALRKDPLTHASPQVVHLIPLYSLHSIPLYT